MDPKDFAIGWICAIPIELAAARLMLDERFDAHDLHVNIHDTNKYHLGRISSHKIVLTLLDSAGNNQASSVALHMTYTFENLEYILMVGVGGGVPKTGAKRDVRLGDVVVSMPAGDYPGVVQHDSGKFLQEKSFERSGVLKAPPKHLQKVVRSLEANLLSEEVCISQKISEKLQNLTAKTYWTRPARERDVLFEAKYVHTGGGDTCMECDKTREVIRAERSFDEPVVHYGNIASGSSVIRDALKRDELGEACGALCVEMEAAGLMQERECLVVRGICDYSDSHKNKDWQPYAAIVAATYTKELLGEVSRSSLRGPQHIRNSHSSTANPSEPSSKNRTNPSLPTSPQKSLTSLHESPRLRSLPSRPTFRSEHNFPPRGSQENGQTLSRTASTPAPDTLGPSKEARRFTFDHSPLPSSHLPFAASTTENNPPNRRSTVDGVTMSGSSLSSEVQLRSLAEGAWDGRKGEKILVDEEVEWYQLQETGIQERKQMSACSLRIFEFVDDNSFFPTRRIVFRSCDDGDQCMSCWMPLDNVHIRLENRVIAIAWSDCAHIMPMQKNYHTTFTCQYFPDNHNQEVEIELRNASGLQNMANILLYPDLSNLYHGQKENVSADLALRVYWHADRLKSTAQIEASDLDFAILETSVTDEKNRFSRLYIGRPCLDFQAGMSQDPLSLTNLRCLHYTSTIEKYSQKDILKHLDPEGAPNRAMLKPMDLELRLAHYEDLSLPGLIESITGWLLLFCKATLAINISKFLPARNKKIKKGLVMVWERTGPTSRDLQLLMRAPNASDESKDCRWWSASLTSPRAPLTIPESDTIDVALKNCLQGSDIMIHEMTAHAPKTRETGLKKIQIQFCTSGDKDAFCDAVKSRDQPLQRQVTSSSKPVIEQHEDVNPSSRVI